MSEEVYIIGGIVCILLVLLMLRNRRKTKASQNIAKAAARPAAVPKAPPPLPVRRAPSLPPRCPDMRVLDFPKCPIDRSRNEPGKPQVVFWDRSNNCYTCCYGHRFTGRE
ncbi:MAG: hypothetical protein IKJ99_09740 [Oscillospiraceae bacterium]|nr:hypothetical protein [Oscillospiraceae bacterium]